MDVRVCVCVCCIGVCNDTRTKVLSQGYGVGIGSRIRELESESEGVVIFLLSELDSKKFTNRKESRELESNRCRYRKWCRETELGLGVGIGTRSRDSESKAGRRRSWAVETSKFRSQSRSLESKWNSFGNWSRSRKSDSNRKHDSTYLFWTVVNNIHKNKCCNIENKLMKSRAGVPLLYSPSGSTSCTIEESSLQSSGF